MNLDLVLLFALGLGVGSFLNVVALRYSPEKGFKEAFIGRSMCPHCKRTLKWFELFPVLSFLIQGGKCRNCKAKISWRYVLVEIASGFIFLLPFYIFNPIFSQTYFLISSVVWISVFSIFILIWLIDFRLNIIPDELNIFIFLLGIILIFTKRFYGEFGVFAGSFVGGPAALFGFRGNIFINYSVALIFTILFFGLIILISRGKGMGLGDLKFMAALSLVFGWPDILFITAFSFITGGVLSSFLLLMKKKRMKDAVPFGPFIVVSAVILFFFGNPIIGSYLNLFGF